MADDITMMEAIEWSKRCTMHSHRIAVSAEESENRIFRLGDIDSDWKAWVSPVFQGITFDTISARHQGFKDAWKLSAWYHACYKAIEETVFAQASLNITTCMCLGLGSFTGIRRKSKGHGRDVSLSQLVAFECWVDQLKTKFTIEHVYLQDPHFSALDEEFLRSKGYEILHTPESDHHISESTFLFTPGAEQAVEESSLAAALPALYIHNDMSPLWLMPPLGPLVDEKRRNEERLLQKVRSKGRYELLNSFVSQRAAIKLPKVPLKEWYYISTIYYKPDSANDISPLILPPENTPTYSWEQAQDIWREKGYLSHLENTEDDEYHKKFMEEMEKDRIEHNQLIDERNAARLKDKTI